MHIKAGDTVVVIAGKDRFTTDKKGKKNKNHWPCVKGLSKIKQSGC